MAKKLTDSLRHNLGETLKEHVQHDLVGYDVFDAGG